MTINQKLKMNNQTPALSVQIGGSHYKDCTIQPVQFIEANQLQFLEGCVVKRITRHDKPTGKGRQDIEKAIHELQLVLELRYPAKTFPKIDFPEGVKLCGCANNIGACIGIKNLSPNEICAFHG